MEFKFLHTFKNDNSWRQHQSDYFLKKRKKKARFRLIRLLLILAFLACGVFFFSGPVLNKTQEMARSLCAFFQEKTAPDTPEEPTAPKWEMAQTRELVKGLSFLNSDQDVFFVDTPEQSFRVENSLDINLQTQLNREMEKQKRRKRGKPIQLAFVVMDARTGQIKALAGYDLETPRANPATRDAYPAASLFKIVTAAAAIDDLGYTPKTPLHFNGNKYTLYKRQLKEVRNKYTVKTTLESAFAESINPVFGKLGKNHLGRERLDRYAQAFGFTLPLPGDMAAASGQFATNESEYHLAELGCGFNQNTMMSPIFAAVMVSAVLNQGKSLVPTIVDRITNTMDETIYKREKAFYKTSMKAATADAMLTLMQKTVRSGTARKSFRRSSRDKVLKHLLIGGKTGSLYNRNHTIKYDWFTGFGKTKNGQ